MKHCWNKKTTYLILVFILKRFKNKVGLEQKMDLMHENRTYKGQLNSITRFYSCGAWERLYVCNFNF